MFIIEGAPAVVMGVIVPFIMTDRPKQARWLTLDEQDWLDATLEEERQETAGVGAVTLTQAVRQPVVWLLGLGILATNTGGYAMVFWLPTAMKNLLESAGQNATPTDVLNFISLVYVLGLAGVWLSGQSSDYFRERKWHCVLGQVATGVFLGASVFSASTIDTR